MAHRGRTRRPGADTGEGNPPHLLRLADGRLCLTYGVRAKPFGMFARLSSDAGATWSEPIVLRNDGGVEISATASVQRADGRVVTIYYFWDQASGPERDHCRQHLEPVVHSMNTLSSSSERASCMPSNLRTSRSR